MKFINFEYLINGLKKSRNDFSVLSYEAYDVEESYYYRGCADAIHGILDIIVEAESEIIEVQPIESGVGVLH